MVGKLKRETVFPRVCHNRFVKRRKKKTEASIEELGKRIGELNFSKLRMELYPVIHSKKRTLEDLIFMWDFFREHSVVCDYEIRWRFLRPQYVTEFPKEAMKKTKKRVRK